MNQTLQEKYNLLSNEHKIQKGLDITRQLIARSHAQTQMEQEEETVIISDDLQSFTLLSIEVSPFPTDSRKIMKYIETQQLKKFLDKADFVEVDDYCIVFVNAEDLSYHNFENILNLDHLFNNVSFELNPLKKTEGIQIFQMLGSTDSLLSLDKLNYYTIPLNDSQRGGKRLIFHSNQLSYSLTEMIEESTFFDRKNFSHVNNVFRLNNFAPGDRKFKSHYDTPFADQYNNLYSKYTMLIYLTGNEKPKKGQLPPLKIENFTLKNISANDCIIFDQMYKHEGNPYIDKNKIFIRTELIYKIDNFKFDEGIAMMFNRACYMTKELEQQQYSADLFNSCVQMRYKLKEQVKVPRVYLMKRNLDVSYITDGNFYWFKNNLDLQSIAMLIILDYFNAKVYGIANLKIHSKMVPQNNKISSQEEEEESNSSIFSILDCVSFSSEQPDKDKVNSYSDTSEYIPKSLCEDFITFQCNCGMSDGRSLRTSKDIFKGKRNSEIRKLNELLEENTVIIFDKMIKLQPKNFKIQKDSEDEDDNFASGKIRLSDIFINPDKKINFASCQCERIYRYDDVVFQNREKINMFCLPDISFQKLENGIKLSIDMFNNGFVYQASTKFSQPYTNENETKQKSRNRNYESSNSDDDQESDYNYDEDEDDDDDDEDSDNEEQNEDQGKDKNNKDTKVSDDLDDINNVNDQQQKKDDLTDINLKNSENPQSQQEEKQEKRKFLQENIQQFVKTKKTID